MPGDDLELDISDVTKDERRTIKADGMTYVSEWQDIARLAVGNPKYLGRILREAAWGDTERALTYFSDMEEREVHYASQVRLRKEAILSLPVRVLPKAKNPTEQHKAYAELLQQSVVESPEFESLLFALADGIFKGYSVVEPVWSLQKHDGQDVWAPRMYNHVDPRWFVFRRPDLNTLYLKTRDRIAEGVPLQPGRFLVYQARTKSGPLTTNGIARQAAGILMFKVFNFYDWVAFCEGFGKPIIYGKFASGQNDAETKASYKKALLALRGSGSAIFPANFEIVVESQFTRAAGTDGPHEQLARFCDEQTSKLVRGSTLTTDSAQNGNRQLGQVHEAAPALILAGDARRMTATAQPLLDLWATVNAPSGMRFELDFQVDTAQQRTEFIEAVNVAKSINLPLSKSELYERLQLQIPTGQLDILESAPPPAESDAGQDGKKSKGGGSTKKEENRLTPAQRQEELDLMVEDVTDDYGDGWRNAVLTGAQSAETYAQMAVKAAESLNDGDQERFVRALASKAAMIRVKEEAE